LGRSTTRSVCVQAVKRITGVFGSERTQRRVVIALKK